MNLLDLLSEPQKTALSAVRKHAEQLLDHTPRFKFFTLHGKAHIDSLFEIADLLVHGGLKFTSEEAYLLSLAICVHDLGMVIPLKDDDVNKILEGRPASADPATLEEAIRDAHHNLAEIYFRENASFLLSSGITPTQLSNVLEISRCHRKVILQQRSGFIKYLGAVLRIIDELDLSSKRAPIAAFKNLESSMDSTSAWHWFKHNIVAGWALGNTVFFRTENEKQSIEFRLVVHPPRAESIPYWLNQIRRPIAKALLDNGCQSIIQEHFKVTINLQWSEQQSSAISLDPAWSSLEERALTAGRKVILVIDDEYRKLIDLFAPLMDKFHLVFASSAKDGIQKMTAHKVDLAIVDMQVGSGFIWSEEETNDFKNTGAKIIDELHSQFKGTKLGVLTGTKHSLDKLDKSKLTFLLRKPIDPDSLLQKVEYVLSR